MSRTVIRGIVGVVFLAVCCSVFAVEVSRDEKGWHISIDKKDVQNAWKCTKEFVSYVNGELFKSHPTVQALTQIDGKDVMLVPIKRDDESRITYNISFDEWMPHPDPNGPQVRIYIGLDPGSESLLDGKDMSDYRMQQKWDAKGASDGNRGDEVEPGQSHRLDGGHSKYYAWRGKASTNGEWDALSGHGYLIIADADLTPEQLGTLKGVKLVTKQ